MLAMPELIDETAQHSRLAQVLPRWFDEIPLYRKRNGTARSAGPRSSQALLHQRSLITKQDIRRNFPRNFLGENGDLEALVEQEVIELEHTAGTSEERTPLLLPRGWWAEQERRALRLNAVVADVLDEFPGARRVTITSPVCSGDIRYTGVPSRDDRIVGNALFVSLSRYPFLLSETDLARMAAEAVEWRPQFLDVDPVYGVVFARYCERHGIRLPTLRFILCSYEFVSVVHRRILQRVFGVPVFNLYGSTETGHLLMEDETGKMQPGLATAFLETLETGTPPLRELVVTTLSNSVMPLIRYRIGDLVEELECPCGTRYLVHGRVLDAFHAAAGRLVTTWQIDQSLADLAGIAHYQLLERPGQWLLRYVPDGDGLSASDAQTLRERLSVLLGLAGEPALQSTDLIVPETSGKFRLGCPARLNP
jgi:phenylacetate-CoA ligase